MKLVKLETFSTEQVSFVRATADTGDIGRELELKALSY